jgi:hypothetical protein
MIKLTKREKKFLKERIVYSILFLFTIQTLLNIIAVISM